jgi:quercetin dioxygenase-like cupin family protein
MSKIFREPWGSMEWLVEDALQPGASLSLARMTVHAGRTSQAHRHPNCDEAVHVLSGRVEQRIGDRLVTLGQGDSAHIPADTVHCSTALGQQDAVMVVAYSAGRRIYEPV